MRKYRTFFLLLLLTLTLCMGTLYTIPQVSASSTTLNDPTEDGVVRDDGDRIIDGNWLEWGTWNVDHLVRRSYVEWDISSIPDTATITDVIYLYHGKVEGPIPGRIVALTVQPSVVSNATLYNAIGSDPSYIATWNPTVGTGKSQDLGTEADEDLESALASNWFAIGFQSSDEETEYGSGVLSAVYDEHYESVSPPSSLQITWTVEGNGNGNGEDGDWLEDWTYRRAISIASATGAGTGYQVPFTLFYGSEAEMGGSAKAIPGVVGFQQCNFMNPSNVYVDGVTYVSFEQKPSLDIYMIKFTHSTATWSSISKVGDNTYQDWGRQAMNIDSDGYIHVFYGSQHNQIKYSRSNNPLDISSFSLKTAPSGTNLADHSNILTQSNGNIFYLYRHMVSGGTPGHMIIRLRKSVNNGDSWTDPTAGNELVDFGDNHAIWLMYVWTDPEDNMHILFTDHTDSGSELPKDVYYAWSEDGTTWKKADGTSITLPIDLGDGDKVYDSSGYETRIASVRLDDSGYPIIFFAVQGEVSVKMEWKIAKWNGATWTIKDTGKDSGASQEGWGEIDSISGSTIRLVLDYWEPDAVEFWKTVDGGDNWFSDGFIQEGINTWGVSDVLHGVDGLEYIIGVIGGGNIYAYGDLWNTAEGTVIFCNNHARTDFGDIRFTDDDMVTNLDYWFEELYNSENASVWVEVADDLSTTSQTIYVYYGNSGASSISNGPWTFPFFDEFNGVSLNASKWDESGTVSVDSGTVIVVGDSYAIGKTSFGHAFAVRALAKVSADNGYLNVFALADKTSDHAGIRRDTVTNYWRSAIEDDPTEDIIATAVSEDTDYHVAETARISGDVIKSFLDNSLVATHTDSASIPDSNLFPTVRAWVAGPTVTCDWVLVRKYVDPEPKATVGAEYTYYVPPDSPFNYILHVMGLTGLGMMIGSPIFTIKRYRSQRLDNWIVGTLIWTISAFLIGFGLFIMWVSL